MPTFEYSTKAPAEVEADLLIVPVYEGPEAGPGVKEVEKALGVSVLSTLTDNTLKGKVHEFLILPAYGKLGAKTVLVVGLGPRREVSADAIRRAAGYAAKWASKYGSVASTLPQAGAARIGPAEAVQAFVEGFLLGSYRFVQYKSKPDDERRLDRVLVLGATRWDARAARTAIERGQVYAEAVAWARDLVNTPAGDATPAFLAEEARTMAREAGLTFKAWTKAELEKGGFGGILGVGQGSANEPRLIELRYRGGGRETVAITGKGITFDSGGLSIKDAVGMEWMKADMGGAAAAIAAMRAIARLKPKINVIAAIPSAENLPSGTALKPGDVLAHRGGKTSEVLNTDAEGRLVLADALAYLAEQKPAAILDAATLTGACMIALGEDVWGVMGNDRRLVREVLDAGDQAGEPGWELPLWRRYKRKIESPVADVKNIGDRYGGAITAALFLAEFVGDVPWAHLDVAGTAFQEKAGDYWPKGATGSPARTFIRW
ncbi:MAG TPA: leucyl aminopeptidase, partial [Actinomycetota bacterium]|nr:leucyl aminopeptidase [Actinomycetota bacterium]